MRIALVHDLPPGGALRFVRESTRLSVAEHHYVLFTAAGTPVDSVLADTVHDVVTVPVHEGHAPDKLGKLHDFFRRQRAIADAIDASDVDVALVHPSQITQAPPVLGALRATPSLYFMHEVRRRTYEHGYHTSVPKRRGIRSQPRALAGRLLERAIVSADRRSTAAATALAANSVFTIESIVRCHGRHATLCHPGVDLERFQPEPLDRRPMVLSVGALDPSKGHDRGVAALALLPPDRRPALTVVYERCDPAFERQIRAQARTAGVELHLRAGLRDSELTNEYASALATMALAPLEPFGLTVLESIACGTPVVALRQGGYRETVTDGANGVLVDADPCSIARGIVMVSSLAQRTSPDELRATITDYWTWDRCVRDLDRALRRTVCS